MTSIGLSFKSTETSATVTELLADQPEGTTPAKKKIPVVLIPSTIGLGLLLTLGYVGGRIFSASAGIPPVVHTVELPPPPQPAAVVKETTTVAKAEIHPLPLAAVPITPTPAVKTSPVSQTELNLITPRTGEHYLQLAALPPKMAIQYVDELKKQNIDAGIAQGPTPENVRVLSGPFASSELLNQAKAKLDAQKVISMVRDY